jgi:hypothetical protein
MARARGKTNTEPEMLFTRAGAIELVLAVPSLYSLAYRSM